MNVYEITARFMRRRQIREYEPVESEIILKAQLVEGEDLATSLATLTNVAKDTVYLAIGIPTGAAPTSLPSTPRPVAVAAPATQAPVTTNVAAPAAATPVTTNVAQTTPEKPSRGRPKLTDEEKAARAAAKAKEAANASDIPDEGTTATAAASDIPDEAAPVVPVSNPAPVVPTAAAASDIPDDVPATTAKPATTGALTSRDMTNIVQKSLVKKYIQPADVKAIMAELSVDRLGDIPADKLTAFYEKISALPGMAGKLQGSELV